MEWSGPSSEDTVPLKKKLSWDTFPYIPYIDLTCGSYLHSSWNGRWRLDHTGSTSVQHFCEDFYAQGGPISSN